MDLRKQACLGKNRGNRTHIFFTIKIGTDTIGAAKTMLKPYSETFGGTYRGYQCTMEYWYGEIQKTKGFCLQQFTRGGEVLF